jgi:hypothetical protein
VGYPKANSAIYAKLKFKFRLKNSDFLPVESSKVAVGEVAVGEVIF